MVDSNIVLDFKVTQGIAYKELLCEIGAELIDKIKKIM
jgi:hypothetical protein